MDILFYAVFAALILIALACQAVAVIIQRRIRRVELLLIERYHAKIDKIPAIVSVLRNHSQKLDEYTELTELHRVAIISPTATIYDLLEINTHVTDRFSFLMRLALAIKSTAKDGNFITIRESITTLEGHIRELLVEFSRLTKQYNTMIKARNYTVVGALFPGSKKPVFR